MAATVGYQEQNRASVSNTPFRNYKGTSHEGGISSPFIVWWPGRIQPGRIAKGTAHLIDLAPTFYELAGASYPATYQGTTVNSLLGRSLAKLLLTGQELDSEQPNVATPNARFSAGSRPLFWERAGNRAVRRGKWKLVSIYPSYQWELYDVEADRGETQNLASQNALVVDEL